MRLRSCLTSSRCRIAVDFPRLARRISAGVWGHTAQEIQRGQARKRPARWQRILARQFLSGVTLVEQLVVLSIILTLMAISFPVYFRALQHAQKFRDEAKGKSTEPTTLHVESSDPDDPLSVLK